MRQQVVDQRVDPPCFAQGTPGVSFQSGAVAGVKFTQLNDKWVDLLVFTCSGIRSQFLQAAKETTRQLANALKSLAQHLPVVSHGIEYGFTSFRCLARQRAPLNKGFFLLSFPLLSGQLFDRVQFSNQVLKWFGNLLPGHLLNNLLFAK